jgi:hypothetical protein
MIIRSPEPEVKILVDRDPIKTSFEEWAKPGHFSSELSEKWCLDQEFARSAWWLMLVTTC